MSPEHRRPWLGLIALALVGVASPTRAQPAELVLATREHGSWAATVAALQADRRAEGLRVHVSVRDASGARARCGRYALALDVWGARALRIGACDPRTDETELVLVARTELFSHDGPIARPRAIRLIATEVRVGDAAGGAALTGGAALECSVSVRPYLDDLEHGGVVYLGADRFFVRPLDATVTAEAAPPGFRLYARAAATTVRYEVVDRLTGEVVLTDSATLACGGGGGAGPTQAEVVPTPDPRSARSIPVYHGRDTGRLTEALGIVDVHEPSGSEEGALHELRRRAAAMGADAVVGVEYHHAEGTGPVHLSGLAVRFLESSLPRE